MNKDHFISTLIGVIIGLVAAVVFTLRANAPQTAVLNGATATSTQNDGAVPLSELSHTNKDGVPTATGGSSSSGMQPQVKAALDAANANPKNVQAQLNAAGMYYQIQQYERAMEFVNRALAAEPGNSNALKAAADIHFDKGDFTTAEKFYEQVLSKTPNDVNVRTDYGSTFFKRTPPDYERAVSEYRKSLAVDSRHENTLQNLSLVLLLKGDKGAAKEAIDQLAAAHPQNTAVAKFREELAK